MITSPVALLKKTKQKKNNITHLITDVFVQFVCGGGFDFFSFFFLCWNFRIELRNVNIGVKCGWTTADRKCSFVTVRKSCFLTWSVQQVLNGYFPASSANRVFCKYCTVLCVYFIVLEIYVATKILCKFASVRMKTYCSVYCP